MDISKASLVTCAVSSVVVAVSALYFVGRTVVFDCQVAHAMQELGGSLQGASDALDGVRGSVQAKFGSMAPVTSDAELARERARIQARLNAR